MAKEGRTFLGGVTAWQGLRAEQGHSQDLQNRPTEVRRAEMTAFPLEQWQG